MKTENEKGLITRRNFLRGLAATAGTLVGFGIGNYINRETAPVQARPSPTPTATETPRPTQTAQPTPTESPTPSPTPEVKVGELPDILNSTDKDWEKYFAKETDLARINSLIKQQQTEENAKARAENRQSKAICLLIFDPIDTAKNGNWTIRKVTNRTGQSTYAFMLPAGTILKAPFEGIMQQRGFANGGKSVDIEGKLGYSFWTLYFGRTEFELKRVVAGENYLRTIDQTQTFKNFGNTDIKGDATILGAALTDPTSPFSSIKWLTNEKGQILHT